MTTKSEKDRAKHIQDKCLTILTTMLRDDDNKYCVDCDAKGPRWASWNIGVFLCIRCAGIHRNLGVHISKVKSVNLDSWTPQQVVSLQQMGNSRARAVYEALLPDGFRRPQTDSSLEAFVRAKYEHKKYIAREWVQPALPRIDWDKEIDEELKKKKTPSSMSGGLSNLNSNTSSLVTKPSKIESIPQLLPKPNGKTASPKSVNKIVEIPKPTSGSADLLGLDNKPSEKQDDVFSGFLSAEPPKVEVKAEETVKDSLKSEEESFFNQPAPTEKEKSKLTKDSIMALYGTTSSATSSNSQAFATNPLSFPTSFSNQNAPFSNQQTAFQSNNSNQSNTFNTNFSNAGASQFQTQGNTQQNYQQFNMPNQFQQSNQAQFQQVTHNQFQPSNQNQFSQQFQMQQQPQQQAFQQNQFAAFSQNSAASFTQNGFQQQGQNGFQQSNFPQNNGFTQTTSAFSQNPNFGQPNQFFGQQQSLNQQFGNLGVSAPSQFGSAGNLWQ